MKNGHGTIQAVTELLNEPLARSAKAETTKTELPTDRSVDALSHLRARFGTVRDRFPDSYEETDGKIVAPAKHPHDPTREKASGLLSVVMVYNDMHAALRAVEAIERIGRKFRGRVRQQIMPAPLSQLHDSSCFERLLYEANMADLLIVSFNGPGDFPAILKKWVEKCFGQKRAGPSAIVALLSSNEPLEAPDSPRYRFLKDATCSAGLNFFPTKPAAG
ncbi:MAG: hypothetical protein ABSH19_02920 [Opitutales bacterium]|jgi:hypothetical protein